VARNATVANGGETRNIAAVRRAEDVVGGISLGEDVECVVGDDNSSRGRVELRAENPGDHDTGFYVEQVARAPAGGLGPFGYTEGGILADVEFTAQQVLHTATQNNSDGECQEAPGYPQLKGGTEKKW
jgi:hypothetical protein